MLGQTQRGEPMPALRRRARRLVIGAGQQVRDRWFVAVIACTFLLGILPFLVQSLTAPKYRVNIGQSATPLSGLATRTNTLALLLLIGVCALAIVLSLWELPQSGHLNLVALLAPWAYLVARDVLLRISVHHLNTFVYPLVVTSIYCLRPTIASLKWMGYLVGWTAIISLAMGEFLPTKGIYHAATGSEITPDKEIFSSGILVGPLSNGNNLGQFLLMGLAAVLLVPRPTWRWVFLTACLVGSLWAASRSCLGATLIFIVVALLLRQLGRSGRALLVSAVTVGATAMVVIVPLVTKSPTAFTNRGNIWAMLKGQWAANRPFGLGSNFFTRIAKTSATLGGSVFHGHNQFMQDLVVGGYVLALLMGALMLAEIMAATRLAYRGFTFPGLYLIGFLGASLLEVSYVFLDRFFFLPVVLVPFACILFTVDHDDVPAEPNNQEPPGENEPEEPRAVQAGTSRSGAGRSARPAPTRGIGRVTPIR